MQTGWRPSTTQFRGLNRITPHALPKSTPQFGLNADRLELSSHTQAAQNMPGANTTAPWPVSTRPLVRFGNNTDISPVNALLKSFESTHKQLPDKVYYAPGRFRVLSNYAAETGGLVLSAAHAKGILLASRARDDQKLTINSQNGEYRAWRDYEFNIQDPFNRLRGNWADLAEAACHQAAKVLKAHNMPLSRGVTLMISGDSQFGQNLGSSTAITLLITKALLDANGFSTDSPAGHKLLAQLAAAGEAMIGRESTYLDSAPLAELAENEAFLARASAPDALQRLNANLPADKTFLIVHTEPNGESDRNVRHTAIMERQRLLDEAFQLLQAHPNFANRTALTDISRQELKQHRAWLEQLDDTPTKDLYRYAMYALSEHARTKRAAKALEAGNYKMLGLLMNASHSGIRDILRVSTPRHEIIRHLLGHMPGVYGSQTLGKGMGGNMLILLDKDQVTPVKEAITQRLQEVFGKTPKLSFTETRPSQGVRTVWEALPPPPPEPPVEEVTEPAAPAPPEQPAAPEGEPSPGDAHNNPPPASDDTPPADEPQPPAPPDKTP